MHRRLFEIDSAARLTGEVFGPILHVVRWPADRLDRVLDEIAATGYGLTLGIHSRIDETVRHILTPLNSYINRSIIGAVVGVPPFGGEGLSGTGPKAGGPHYLHRFATERTVSTDHRRRAMPPSCHCRRKARDHARNGPTGGLRSAFRSLSAAGQNRSGPA